MTDEVKRPPGRPRKAAEARRVPFGMRTTPAIRALLEAAAAASGRSLAGEIEYRLQASFDDEARRGELRTLIREELSGLR